MEPKSTASFWKHLLNWTLYKEAFQQWSADDAGRLAASLSYHSAMAMAPLIIGVLAIVGLVYDTKRAQEQLVAQVNQYIGPQGAETVNTILANADHPILAKWAGILSLIVLIWSASNIFAQLQDSLNTAWGVQLRKDLPLLRKVQHRLLPLLVVLVIGVLLLAAVIASSALSALGAFFSDLLPGGAFLWQVVNYLVSLAVITLLFALVFKLLPDVKIAWHDVWPGALLTALLFVLGQFVLGWYLGRQSSASLYGAAGSLIIVLLWFYYSAQIFLFGAEFTQVYATRYGHGVLPDKDAVSRGQDAPVKPAAQAADSGAEKPQFADGAQNDGAVVRSPQRIPQRSMAASAEQPLALLVIGLIDDGRSLFEQEIALAKAEIRAMAAKIARGVSLTIGGGMVLYAALVAVLVAVALLLSAIMPIGYALLLVGILVLVEGWIVMVWARHRLSEVRLTPVQTIETVNQDFGVLKERLVSEQSFKSR